MLSDENLSDPSLHPSFSLLYEAPYSEHPPFQDGPNISFNGEVSTFLPIPVKRNDRPLSANVASGPHPSPPGVFMSLIKSLNGKPGGPGGPIGGLKPSSMRYLDFKKALLPSMLAAIQSMHQGAHSMTKQEIDDVAEAGSANAPAGRKVGHPHRGSPPEIHTNPAAQAELLLADSMHDVSEGERRVLTEEQDKIRRHLFETTGLILPSDTQWYLLNELRIHAGAPERSEEGIDRLSHYYAQLLYLEPKFPFETDEIQMNFTWYESFVPDRKVVTNCIQYEKASVLFNIAAVYATLASSQSLWTPDGKRKAASYFQKAAGVLCHIGDRLCARFKPKLDRASDLNEATLKACAELMLAQAMECFYEKANDTKASSGVTSKIAAQSADFYEVALRACESPTELCKSRFPRVWVEHIRTKSLLFTAIAHMHTAPLAAAESAIGERIARVSVAKDVMAHALKSSKDVGGALLELVQGHAKIIETAHSFLIHANFERHHHPSYNDRLLPPLKRPQESLVMASPLAEAVTDPRNFRDMFHSIMNPSSHSGMRQLMEDCARKVDLGRGELMAYVVDIDCELATLGLSHALISSDHRSEAATNGNLSTRVQTLLEHIRACETNEDIFAGCELLDCFQKLVKFSEININEALKILNDHSDSASSTQLSTVRAAAVTCNTHVTESMAKLGDHTRKWDNGIGEIANYTESDVSVLLPIAPEKMALSAASTPHLDSARREREILLLKVGDLRRFCEETVKELSRLGAPVDDFSARTTSMSIDVHSAIAARNEQLQIVESAVRTAKSQKDNYLRRLKDLSLILYGSYNRHSAEAESSEIVSKLQKAAVEYLQWRNGLVDDMRTSFRTREESARILARCLQLPKGGGGTADAPDGGGNVDSSNNPPKSPVDMTDSARDPIMRVLMANGSIPHLSSHPASPRIPPVSPSSDGNGNLTIPVPINRATTPSLTPLPYNPDVVHLETSHSLAELRSLLASTGVVPSVRPTPRHVESANLLPSLLESRAASALPGSIEAGLRDMLHAQQEQLALLMSEKALRDIDNSKTQEKIYLQQIERQQQQQEHEDFSKILSDRNKPSQGATQVRRKPATPGGIMKGGSHANLPSNRAVSGDFSRSNSGLPGAEKLKQMLRFVGVKKDATQDNLGGPSNTRLNTAALHPTSRMTSYATAFEGVTNDRNISDLSKRSGDPNIPHRPFKGTAGARRVISSTLKEASYGGNDSQPSVIEHASYTISDSPPLTDICLSDYDPSLKSHGKEHGVSKLTLQSQTEIDLPSRMDDIYGQVRALMLSQDALRTQNANAMREALDTILESHNARLGGVEDAVSNWTQRKIEDARNRLTDALRRFEREERRKIELERQAERERSRTKDLQRSAESNLQKGREVRHQVAHDASGASQKRRESGLRAYIERQGKEAESRWRSVHDTGIQRSGEDHKGKLPMQDHPDYTGDALGTDFVGPMQYARIESWVDEQRRMSTTSSKHGKSHKPRLSGKETGTQTTLCEAGGHLVSGHHIPVISPACEGSAKFQQHNNFVARRFLGDGSPPAGSDTHP